MKRLLKYGVITAAFLLSAPAAYAQGGSMRGSASGNTGSSPGSTQLDSARDRSGVTGQEQTGSQAQQREQQQERDSRARYDWQREQMEQEEQAARDSKSSQAGAKAGEEHKGAKSSAQQDDYESE
ncbi:MAG: hypothetical protein J5J00_09490 [Deltaproteobacteria bacterium]|nr:hypothetical protein [Deltaproteobacteria bacterium]